jgi:hypothetical protein
MTSNAAKIAKPTIRPLADRSVAEVDALQERALDVMRAMADGTADYREGMRVARELGRAVRRLERSR